MILDYICLILLMLIDSASSLYLNGKIYVVVAVVAIVLVVLFILLFRISNKIKSIEEKLYSNE